ncbi:MAG: DNA mismatch repair protein MutS, partial [Clostridia bacterium]|nr:DNA mismatch repair protein MutS [Clostridia bacterium]
MAMSPMMVQIQQIKARHEDCIVMSRIGDFYEMFFEDAKIASRELDLVLTGKDCGLEERAPMCGVPYHALDQYLSKLVSKGYRVAIVEQLEDPATAKGLVKRDVIRIVTPGTVTEGGYLRESENNYIASVYTAPDGFGLAFADVSTGEMFATEILGANAADRAVSEAAAYGPSEIIHTSGLPEDLRESLHVRYRSLMTEVPEEDTADLTSVYGSFFQETGTPTYGTFAVGQLLRQLTKTQKTDLSYLKEPVFYEPDSHLGIDHFSRRNLELCETLRTGERRGSLLGTVDRTRTSAGARLLKKWIEKPLMNCVAIRSRQKAVQTLFDDTIVRNELMDALRGSVDVERLTTKLVYGSANARDLKALEKTLKLLPGIKEKLDGLRGKSGTLDGLNGRIHALEEVADAIGKTIDEDPAMVTKEGGIIKPGCNAAVDELRAIMHDGKSWISRIEES